MHTSPTRVKDSPRRTPGELESDGEAHALKGRSVYTQRAIDALSSPLQDLWSLLGDESATRFAAAELQEQGRQIADCCSKSHVVPILARMVDGAPVGGTGAVLAPHHCGRPLCTRCERRDQTHGKSRARLKAALERALGRRAVPRFITLTITNEKRLGPALCNLNEAALRLRHTPEWAHHITGGVRALEVTYNDGVRRRLRRQVAAQHGLMTGNSQQITYIEEVERTRNTDGTWTTTTRKRDLDKRDAAQYLDTLHAAGADIYRETPWTQRRCSEHGTEGCETCDPTGWHPHHHIVAEGEFWLGLCEVCNRHSRHNCPECRAVNAKRKACHRDGIQKGVPERRGFSRVCGGKQDRKGLLALKSLGTAQMGGESDSDRRKRMRRHKGAFDWMLKNTLGRCRLTQLRKQLANEHRLGNAKGWNGRRTATVERLGRKIDDMVTGGDDDPAARCLSCAWADATRGASNVVDVREVSGWKVALEGGSTDAVEGVYNELLKYLTKSAVMPRAALVEFAWVMRRKRRVAWFGDWQGIDIEATPVLELRSSTQFASLWDAIHEPDAPRRLYFKGPAELCLVALRYHPGAELWDEAAPGVGKDLPPGWKAGSVLLGAGLAAQLYTAAAQLIPERPPSPPAAKKKGAAPAREAPKPEQVAVPF